MALEVATYSQILTILTQLSTNYTNFATEYYKLFFDDEPQIMDVQIITDDGSIKTIQIPNRAMDRAYILNGSGEPEGTVTADKGSIYQDLSDGEAFIKASGNGTFDGWSKLISQSDLDSYLMQGSGSPEGVVTAAKGIMYADVDNAALYIKSTSTGNTGWIMISATTTTLATVNLDNLTAEGEAHFANPSLSNLNTTGNAVINSKENANNKVNNITSTSSNTQYPSAKATYDFVNNSIEPLANRDLDNLTVSGEYHFLGQSQVRDCILAAPQGVATYSGTVAILPANMFMLVANGFDDNKHPINDHVTLESEVRVNITGVNGKDCVLFYDRTNSTIRYCAVENYYRQNSTPTIENNLSVWFNTGDYHYYRVNNNAWARIRAVEVGRFTIAADGSVYSWEPYDPIIVATQDELDVTRKDLEKFTKELVDGASGAYQYNGDNTFTKKDVVFVDSLNTSINPPPGSPHADDIWLYTSPVYPYVPMTTQTAGTSHTFTRGGMVICTSATNVTLNSGELSPLVFTGFVGILPVSVGTKVTTSKSAFFAGY